MKHLPQIHHQLVSQQYHGFAMESIAQEGFVDGFKDFFTTKASPSNTAIVHRAAEKASEVRRTIERIRPFPNGKNTPAIRFLFKNEKLVNDLSKEMLADAKVISKVNEVLAEIVKLLSRAERDDEGKEIETALNNVISRARAELDDVNMLGNFYFSFRERSTSEMVGSHIDEQINPSYSSHGIDGILGIVIGLVFYVFDNVKAGKMLDQVNTRMEIDIGEFKKACGEIAKVLAETKTQVEKFVSEYQRNKKHDNKHVRHVLRYGHNVVGVATYIAGAYTPFLNYVD